MTQEQAVLDPAEALSQTPAYPKREDSLKTVMDKLPGHITWASDRGSFSGCRAITFMAGDVAGLTDEDRRQFEAELREAKLELHSCLPATLMNAYFSKRANLLVVAMTSDVGEFTVLVTTQMDDDDLEEFQEVSRRVHLEMAEWREQRNKKRLEEVEKAREERRLIEVGRIHEANCKKGE